MITKSDLKIIKECLQAEGVRNSDFLEASKVVDKDNSYIAFIYEGKNYKIKVSNFEAIKSIIFNGNTFTPDENGNVVITQKDAITLVKFYGPEFPIYTTLPEPNIKDGDYFYHTYSHQLMQWQNRGWHVVTLQPGLYFMLPDSSLWLYTKEQGLVRLLEDKQDLLISGTNIKTINGKSILGQGDLTITASQGSTIINYNGSQFLKIDDITDFSFPSSMVQGSIPEGGQVLYDSVRHRFIYVVNGIMYTLWPLMEGVMASDAYATADFVYKLGATVRIWKVTPNGLIDLVGTTEEDLELVPFYAVKEEECPLVLEECSTEGVITYMQAYNVFALYKESNNTYYLLWTETQDRKGNGEYNLIDLSTTEAPYEKEENDPVYTIRQDRLFYLEVNAEDLMMQVDDTLSIASTNPVTNSAITRKFNQVLETLDKVSGFKNIYEISYAGNPYDSLPEGDDYHKYALDDSNILYTWNSSTGEWDIVERESEAHDIVIYQGKIGYLYPDELEWQATIAIPEDYRPMLIDSLLPNGSIYLVEMPTYTGDSGIVVVDTQRNKALLKVTNGSTVKYYNKWIASDFHASSDFYQPSNTLYIFISDGNLHMGIVKDSNFIELAVNGNITIDNGLSPNSSNPVKNSAIYNKFNEVSLNFNNLSSIVNGFSNTRFMPIDGVVTEEYSLIHQQGYGGSDGKILIDEANARIVLFVEGTPNKGYTNWGDAGGRYLSSEYDIHNQFFWLIDSNDALHIYKYLEREVESESQQGITPVLLMASPQSMSDTEITALRKLVEVASSENVSIDTELNTTSTNPVENKVVTRNINAVNSNITALRQEILNREGIRILCVDGVISTDLDGEVYNEVYSGTDGYIVLYAGGMFYRPEILLAVNVDNGEEIVTEYYKKWEAMGIHPDSNAYSVEDWTKVLIMWKDVDGIHIGSVLGAGTVLELAGNEGSTITVDNALSTTSSNPVANSVVTGAINSITSNINTMLNSITSIMNSNAVSGTPMLRIDGFVTENYQLRFNEYSGTGGEILLDKANAKVLLKVNNKYYDKWEAASDKPASTAYKLGSILLWQVVQGALHIYRFIGNGQIVEVGPVDNTLDTSSLNPVQNKVVASVIERLKKGVIQIIGVRGPSYDTQDDPLHNLPDWEEGMLWYNPLEDEFKVCTSVTNGVPTFADFIPEDWMIYHYVFDSVNFYFRTGAPGLSKIFSHEIADTVEHLSESEVNILETLLSHTETLANLEDRISHLESPDP